MLKHTSKVVALVLAVSLGPVAAMAQDTAQVEFEAGNDNAAIYGTILGDC
jgi:hypothetical protein